MPGMIPGRHSQSDMFDTGVEVGLKVFDALLRCSCGCEAFNEFNAEVRRIVFVEEGFAFIECYLAVFFNVDVVVELSADF